MPLVRSSLKIDSLIRHGNYSKYINYLDNVQYKFSKIIVYVFNIYIIHITRDTVFVVKNFLNLNSPSTRCKLGILCYFMIF